MSTNLTLVESLALNRLQMGTVYQMDNARRQQMELLHAKAFILTTGVKINYKCCLTQD